MHQRKFEYNYMYTYLLSKMQNPQNILLKSTDKQNREG